MSHKHRNKHTYKGYQNQQKSAVEAKGDTMENTEEKLAMSVIEEMSKITDMPTTDEAPATTKEAPTAGDMIEKAFTQAVVATVQNDEKVQSEIMEGAEKVIQNKTSEIKARAEREAKEAYFYNKKSACECFGYNEATTEKWAVSFMSFWHNIITAIWIVAGMFTFAPVVFVSKKLSVIIKSTWLAVVVAVIIYVIAVLSPLWMKLLYGGAV